MLLAAESRHYILTRKPQPFESVILSPRLDQKDQTNDHFHESLLTGVLRSHRTINFTKATNLGLAYRSKKFWSKDLEGLATPKMPSHLGSQSVGIKDLINISHESRLHLALNCQPNMILHRSHAYFAGPSTAALPRQQAFRTETGHPMSREVMERQRLLHNFFNMQHSSALSNKQQFDRENVNCNHHSHYGLFPVKLHRLLQDLDQDQRGVNIAHFVPNGTAFVVLDSHRFETEVMKEYFPRMSTYSSFQKQLNLYDFRRVHYASSDKAYYHPSFFRDFPSLCTGIERRKLKQNVQNRNG
jgi:HSF-type DNA-binding